MPRRGKEEKPGKAAKPGKVFLVGAGPGSPDLLTVKARRVIGEAEVVLYDQLAGGVRELLPAEAERIDCGKSGSRHTLEQEEIEGLMVDRALAGKKVVRLKGGDPFLFGRGGEELEALRAAGVPVEIVPGVTSAIAVPGCVGIPVTHRDHASELVILTGHEEPGKAESSLDLDLLARFRGTIVILMGVKNLASIASGLVGRGKDPATPVAIIEKGLAPGQRVTAGPLGEIGGIARSAKVKPPAVIVIGGVVGLYDEEELCGAKR
ncbi:MAG TPA: uroporphyrinogen-III C-methyltransferase [Methanomicrobiales archaeon]|nr:uroporphyrinogen-III C-methyltransferase [Methanomicrobiales archaeon]